MQQEPVRWRVTVSRETDVSLRDFLGPRAKKRGERSKFIEQAVRAHIFHRMVEDIRARNADSDQAELQALIDKTVREVRNDRYGKARPSQQ